MATVADLAREYGAQPYEVKAFANLGNVPDAHPLTKEDERFIREAWAMYRKDFD